MTMRSPVLAMLWENWRLTRLEAASRFALGLVGGSILLIVFAAGAPERATAVPGPSRALFVVGVLYSCLWLSIAKLNGGRFLDGYHPGFPLHLLYTRPVRTSVFVGVLLAYAAASAGALYLVWAVLMRMAFGYPFPLLPAAAWIAALQLVQAAGYWSTRSKLVQWVGTLVAYFGCLVLILHPPFAGRSFGEEMPSLSSPDQWQALFNYSLADYTLIVAIGLVAFGVTVVGVARQRCGDAGVVRPRIAGLQGSADWLVNLARLPCPTSSVTRAQVWFDLKSRGLSVLATGLVLAMAIPLLYAIGGPVAFVRPYAVAAAGLSVIILFLLGGNAFGVRRKQGRTYASVFDATQAYGTGWLAAVRVLVRTVCLVAALAMVGVSAWLSLPLVSGWAEAGREAAMLLDGRGALETVLRALTGYQQAALIVILLTGTAVIVAMRAALEALWARYRRRLIVVGSLLLLYGLMFVLRALMGQGGSRWESLADVLFAVTPWMALAAIALATMYLLWRGVAERFLTSRQACGGILLSAVFAVAWATMLDAAGVQVAAMSMAAAGWILSPVLLPLLASAVAPWSLSRIRHA